MTELSKNYVPAEVESAIYSHWLKSGAFHATPDERDETYVIMMPLPNVTGALHMGHAMDNVVQDLLTRWHRMQGDNTLWMPGSDHAGIATQAVVEKRLKELEGKTRHDIGRDGLVDRIWKWKDQYEERIIKQQQAMGCGADWERHRFTMDPICAKAVRHWFYKMFDDGLVFRGKRLVNWDVFLQTSVSDDEVYHESVQGHFWHLRYPIIDPKPGEPTHVTVATTRPETMLGDTAVCVHPDPEGQLDLLIDKARAAGETEQVATLEARKADKLALLSQLRDMAKDGRQVMLPLLDRPMPLITDLWAKPELGSGCVKITPAHDPNDYDVWGRHKDQFDAINILNPDGTFNAAAGPYATLDRFDARKRIVADMDALGLLARVEDREVEIGHSDRSKTPIEPYLSDQWFIHMGDVEGGITLGAGTAREHTAPGLVQAAMDAVTDGRVSIHPERYTNTYLNWLAEKRDWPISRQLWWGHQIPVWSKRVSTADAAGMDLSALIGGDGTQASVKVHDLDDGAAAVDVCLLADNPTLIATLEGLGFERDPDVLDTWFSSALWPFSTLGWPDSTAAGLEDNLLDYFYPGSCLVTGRDIITLWVARMVLAGLYCIGDIPFSDVFIHANIQDGNGERMSKSKGNGIDPVDIIEAYGTDAMRYVLCDMQTGSQDIRLPVLAVCPSCSAENDLQNTKTGRTIFVRICGKCGKEFDVLGTMPDVPRGKLISKRFEVGRSFCTKLWNSARFAFMNLEGEIATDLTADELAIEDRWILDSLNQACRAVNGALENYHPSSAINAARDFFWNSLCDWYLELIKPRLYGDDERSAAVSRAVLAYSLDQVLRLLHPFVPFITEHLWKELGERVPSRDLGALATLQTNTDLIAAKWPTPTDAFEAADLRAPFEHLQAVTRVIREVRASNRISPRTPLTITVKASGAEAEALREHGYVISHLARLDAMNIDANAVRAPGSAVKLAGALEIHVLDAVDENHERDRLTKQAAKLEKGISGLERKLGNPGFVKKAPPEVIEEQKSRLARDTAALKALQQALALLG